MNFELSDRAKDFRERLLAFMDEHVYPAEPVWTEQVRDAGSPHVHPPVMEDLKAEARRRGLWNLFLPDPEHGAGLADSTTRRWPRSWGARRSRQRRATATRRTPATWRSCTSSGRPSSKERWLRPLLDGEIRSAFAMTEPDVASSDATNIEHAHRARRRRVHAQRAQVVDDGRAAPELPDPHRDGQDRSRRADLRSSSRWCSSRIDTPGRRGRAQPHGIRLHRPRGPRRAAVR